MRRFLFLLLAAAIAAMCADDPWTAVTKLKSGTEIRVLKKGSTQAVSGKFDEANDERLLLVVKNEQISIPKEQVDRVDARNAADSGRVKVDGKTTVEDPQAAKEPAAGMNAPAAVGTTTTSAVSIGSKPGFETVYRRPLGAPKSIEIKK
jgi:hypothetical protein